MSSSAPASSTVSPLSVRPCPASEPRGEDSSPQRRRFLALQSLFRVSGNLSAPSFSWDQPLGDDPDRLSPFPNTVAVTVVAERAPQPLKEAYTVTVDNACTQTFKGDFAVRDVHLAFSHDPAAVPSLVVLTHSSSHGRSSVVLRDFALRALLFASFLAVVFGDGCVPPLSSDGPSLRSLDIYNPAAAANYFRRINADVIALASQPLHIWSAAYATSCLQVVHTNKYLFAGCMLPARCGPPSFTVLGSPSFFAGLFGDQVAVCAGTHFVAYSTVFNGTALHVALAPSLDYGSDANFVVVLNGSDGFAAVSSACVAQLKLTPSTVSPSFVLEHDDVIASVPDTTPSACPLTVRFLPTIADALAHVPLRVPGPPNENEYCAIPRGSLIDCSALPVGPDGDAYVPFSFDPPRVLHRPGTVNGFSAACLPSTMRGAHLEPLTETFWTPDYHAPLLSLVLMLLRNCVVELYEALRAIGLYLQPLLLPYIVEALSAGLDHLFGLLCAFDLIPFIMFYPFLYFYQRDHIACLFIELALFAAAAFVRLL